MPIKVQYNIYDSQHQAPMISTTDYTTANIEYRECLRKGGDFFRMEQIVTADGELTKEEEYLMLVYTVRKMWRRYFDQGRKKEDLMASLAEEKKLDDWNARTRNYLDTHPDYGKGTQSEAFSFFLIVEQWRHDWKAYRKYCKSRDVDALVAKEMGKQCRDYEKKIDKYVRDKLKLI